MAAANYVYFKGGMFGDLIFTITNNGVHLPVWLQGHFKSAAALDLKFQLFATSLPGITTLTGGHSDPLTWNLNNYEVVCSDKKIATWAVQRLIIVHPTTQPTVLLKQYFPSTMAPIVDQLDDEKCMLALSNIYHTVPHHSLVPATNLIDVACIFDATAFIDQLSNHFDFDRNIARQLHGYWMLRETILLKQANQLQPMGNF